MEIEKEKGATMVKTLNTPSNSLHNGRGKDNNLENPPDERLTRKQICSLYKISAPTLHDRMKKGLPYEKCGRKTLFRREDVDNFFKEKRQQL